MNDTTLTNALLPQRLTLETGLHDRVGHLLDTPSRLDDAPAGGQA